MEKIKSVWKYAQFQYLLISTKTNDSRQIFQRKFIHVECPVDAIFLILKCDSEIYVDRMFFFRYNTLFSEPPRSPEEKNATKVLT